MKTKLTVNNKPVSVQFSPTDRLLDVLRNNGFSEVKEGCRDGECGACVVLLNGKLVNSCQVLAASAMDATVTTVKGLEKDKAAPIQEAFVDAGAVQCGFCTPGMVLATYALLQENPAPDTRQIQQALDGNLCRCTGYVKIIEAVQLAAERTNSHE
ncbi:MAG: (2Fe-2S)-binding protein [Acidobacteria bacterium]|nr:MAG: (2Fe-2S)-binding protein [Acidobacteriota bacterium]RLE23169.1 MAG: (2Fe-2S)-binding protein [Acidobacteriota bacterium]